MSPTHAPCKVRWGVAERVLQSILRGDRRPPISMRVRLSPFVLCLLALVLSGCATTSVQVEGEFPSEPLIEQLPLTIGIHFDESFASYQIDEPVPQRGDWSISMGGAQLQMFRTVLPAMFERVMELEDPAAPADVDAVLRPRVDDMQFAIPFQTKSNFFEVWIRYQLTLTEPGSERIIASWPLTAYGRTRDAFLEGAEAAIEQAAVMALRDAAAFLAIDFAETRELAPWLAEKLPAATAAQAEAAAEAAAEAETLAYGEES
ncbi:MAG: hypothetical protein VX766_12075 [Pseudomonadota bacterium]|nr:hypothetical protein [Pseudomonadota bacterium]